MVLIITVLSLEWAKMKPYKLWFEWKKVSLCNIRKIIFFICHYKSEQYENENIWRTKQRKVKRRYTKLLLKKWQRKIKKYENNRERLQEQAWNSYRNICEEEKDNK